VDEPDATMDTARHATHDRELVAALIDRELTGSERERARALVDACTACATLHDDLRTLAVAARDLPVPARPRDFMLSPADAERLRPTLIRRLLGAIGTSRDAVSRPLAMGLTTLGLAGLLVATVPSALQMGGATSAVLSPVGESIDIDGGEPYSLSAAPGDGAPASVAPARVNAGPDEAPAAGAGEDDGEPAAQEFGRDTAAEPGGDRPEVALAPDPTGISTLVVVSGSLFIIGLGLFALRWTARRFGG